MGKAKGAIVVDKERCKGCELCVGECPTNVIRMAPDVNNKGYHFAFPEYPENCTGCANCAMVCPDVAIIVYRKKPEK